MESKGITKDKNIFKGFYQGKVHVSRVFHIESSFSFEHSTIFLSFHDLATGDILQTKPMKAYINPSNVSSNRVDVNLIFKAHGYYILEFHGLKEGDELGFSASF